MVFDMKGEYDFKEQFDAEISILSLAPYEDLKPSKSKLIGGYGKYINQFEASDTKTAVTPLSKMNVVFGPEVIVFSDGLKPAAPE